MLMFYFLVEMYSDGELFATGTVVERTEKVHNRDLKDNEAKICVESVVVSNAKHPAYVDDIEVGSFVAWPIKAIIKFCP